MIHPVRNFQGCTVIGTYDADDTTISVDDASNIAVPGIAVWFRADLYPDALSDPNRELVEITAKNVSGQHTLTVSRGMETALGGLAASTKSTTGGVYRIVPIISAGMWEAVRQAAVDTGLTAYITEHGGVGDGVANDNAALVAAIAAGSDIVLPPGTWLVNGSIALKSDLRIRGAGVGRTIIKLKNSAGAVHIFTGTSLSRVTLEDLTIDCNETNNSTALDAIHLNGITYLKLDGVEIKNVRANGVALGNDSGSAKQVLIRGCAFINVRGDMVQLSNRNNDNEGVIVSESFFDTPGYGGATDKSGISVFGRVVVDACTFKGIAGDNNGIWLRDTDGTFGAGAHRSSVSNCYMVGSLGATVSRGVRCDADDCSLSEVTVDTFDRGIDLLGDDNFLSQCRSFACEIGMRVSGNRNVIDTSRNQASGSGNTCLSIITGATSNKVVHSRNEALSSATGLSDSGTSTYTLGNLT